MDTLSILKSPVFKDIFNKYFILDEGVFTDDDKSKVNWCFMDKEVAYPYVSEYNNLIQKSYIFYITSNGYFALFYSLIKNTYDSVIFVDTEGGISIIGSSVFDFVFNFEEYAFQNDHNNAFDNAAALFYKECQVAFGALPPVVDLDAYIDKKTPPESEYGIKEHHS